MSENVLYEKILSENEDKGFQIRLVLNEFRGEQYLHIRKYFLSYEGEYIPTKEGAAFPATLYSIRALLEGLIELCSYEESTDSINKYFKERLEALNNEQDSRISK